MWALEKEAVLQYNSTTWKLAYLTYLLPDCTSDLGGTISKGTSLRVAGASDF